MDEKLELSDNINNADLCRAIDMGDNVNPLNTAAMLIQSQFNRPGVISNCSNKMKKKLLNSKQPQSKFILTRSLKYK